MSAYHKYISVLIGVAFAIVLQSFSTFRFLVPTFIAFVAVVSVYNYYYLKSIDKYNIWLLVKPVLIIGSGFGIFFLLLNDLLRGTFLVSAVFVIAFFEMFLGNFAENVQINEMLFMAFSFFVAFFGFNQYYPPYHFLYIVGLFASTYLIGRSFLEFIPQEPAIKHFVAVCFALFATELFWVLTFLPFHYSVLGALLFNMFYFMIMLNHFYSFNLLNQKKFQFHLIIMAVFSLILLLATPWRILT